MDEYIIRKYTPDDISRIVHLWKVNEFYRELDASTLEGHLLWKYNQQFTKLWIAQKNDTIVATLGEIVHPLRIAKDEVILGNWGVDALRDKTHPPKEGIFVFGAMFKKALADDYKTGKPFLLFTFPRARLQKTFMNIGWKNIPIFWRFTKELAAPGYRSDKVQKEFTINKVHFSLIDRFDPSWDGVLRSLCAQYKLINVREAQYCNWRYFAAPQRKYYVFLVREDSRIKGYIVLKEEEVMGRLHGYVVDLLLDPRQKELFKIMMTGALFFFRNKKIVYMHTYLSYRTFRSALRAIGFTPVAKVPFIVLAESTTLLRRVVKNMDEWFITPGDGDCEMETIE